jgi:hypothetical protein
MKRKIISFVGLILFVGVVALNLNTISTDNQSNEVLLKNIEAIASGGGYEVDCYPEQTSWGDGYYRCDAQPCPWIDGKGGKGDKSTCLR